MPAQSERVRLATPADRAPVVATVVAAFEHDPAFRLFFAADAFTEQAALFVGALFDRRVARQAVWVVDDGAGVAMWEPPGGPTDDDVDVLPDDARARLGAWDSAVHHLMPTEPHWYLGILATHPSHAGQGLAKLAAAPGLATATGAGLSCWLETATAANVAMYERRGWTVVGAVEVDGVTCTVMRTP